MNETRALPEWTSRLPRATREKLAWSGECLVWTGCCTANGYGKLKRNKKSGTVHRWVYLTFVGPVPAGLQLDHLCRNRRCCRPEHLEPVTAKVNNLRGHSVAAKNSRKTHCTRGHVFDESNTTITKAGTRRCRACMRAHTARWKIEHPDRWKEINDSSYAKHRDKKLAYFNEYNAKRREEIRAYMRVYNATRRKKAK